MLFPFLFPLFLPQDGQANAVFALQKENNVGRKYGLCPIYIYIYIYMPAGSPAGSYFNISLFGCVATSVLQGGRAIFRRKKEVSKRKKDVENRVPETDVFK